MLVSVLASLFQRSGSPRCQSGLLHCTLGCYVAGTTEPQSNRVGGFQGVVCERVQMWFSISNFYFPIVGGGGGGGGGEGPGMVQPSPTGYATVEPTLTTSDSD